MELLVLMQNDYPIGIYTTEALGMAAARDHYERYYKNFNPNRTMEDFHYRTYKFVVDGAAK